MIFAAGDEVVENPVNSQQRYGSRLTRSLPRFEVGNSNLDQSIKHDNRQFLAKRRLLRAAVTLQGRFPILWRELREKQNFVFTFLALQPFEMEQHNASTKKRNVRILCLDGGGVKGVSSLRMLKEIMNEVDQLEKLKESKEVSNDENSHGIQGKSRSPLKPCEYFDLICGTSTGGLIALMLGRLEYVSVCEESYAYYSNENETDSRRCNSEISGTWRADLQKEAALADPLGCHLRPQDT